MFILETLYVSLHSQIPILLKILFIAWWLLCTKRSTFSHLLIISTHKMTFNVQPLTLCTNLQFTCCEICFIADIAKKLPEANSIFVPSNFINIIIVMVTIQMKVITQSEHFTGGDYISRHVGKEFS